MQPPSVAAIAPLPPPASSAIPPFVNLTRAETGALADLRATVRTRFGPRLRELRPLRLARPQ